MEKQKSSARAEELYNNLKEDYSKLVKELKKLIEEGQRSGDILLLGAAYYYISIAYYDNNKWDDMLLTAIKAVTYLDKTEEYELIARAHIALSIVYEEQENSLMSFEECDKAYQILKKHKINNGVTIIALNNLATCYQMMNDHKSSIDMIDECIKLLQQNCADDIENLAMLLINKANFYEKSGRIDESKEILNSISSWIDKVEFKPLVCDYYLRLATNTYELGDIKEARKLVEKGISIVPDNMFPLPLYEDFREVGHHAIENGQRDIADKILEIMKVFVEKNKGSVEQTIAYRFFADYYRGLNEFEKAAEYYVILDKMYDDRMHDQQGSQCKAYTKMKLANAELDKLNKKIKEKEFLASREPLTGLLNRSGLLTTSSNFIATAYKRKQKIGAIFVDIDYFKEYNDTYGHAKGDNVIKLVADIFRKEEKDNIRFARYGGDEFFGITHGLKDKELIDVAKHICHNIKISAIANEGSPYKIITLSVGVINVDVNENTKTIIDMVKFSDKAMYHAKNDGKNTIYLLSYNVDSESTYKKIV